MLVSSNELSRRYERARRDAANQLELFTLGHGGRAEDVLDALELVTLCRMAIEDQERIQPQTMAYMAEATKP